MNFLCGSQTITLTAVVILLEPSRLLRWAAAKNTRRCPAEVEKPLAQPETRNTTVARSGRGRPAIPDMLGPGAKLQTRAVLLAWILVAACLCKSALAQSREGAQWSRRELLGSGECDQACRFLGGTGTRLHTRHHAQFGRRLVRRLRLLWAAQRCGHGVHG